MTAHLSEGLIGTSYPSSGSQAPSAPSSCSQASPSGKGLLSHAQCLALRNVSRQLQQRWEGVTASDQGPGSWKQISQKDQQHVDFKVLCKKDKEECEKG